MFSGHEGYICELILYNGAMAGCVRDILAEKGVEVFAIASGASVAEAARLMKLRNVGALLVDDGSSCIGIITERDIIRFVAERDGDVRGLEVGHIMVSREHLIVAEPNDECRHVMAVMIQKRIRHMPVVEHGRITGFISIRDVARAGVVRLKAEAHFLSDYIA